MDNFDQLLHSEQEKQISNLDEIKERLTDDLVTLEGMVLRSKHKMDYVAKKEELEEKDHIIAQKLAEVKKKFFHGSAIPEEEAEEGENDQRAANEQLIAMGDEIGQEAINKGEEILEKLRKANQMMMDMEEEVFEQRLKLLRIRDNINESQSLANRSKEVLDYFSKALAKDKIIRILVVIMSILIIGIFVMMFAFESVQEEISGEQMQKDVEEYEQLGLKIEDGKITADLARAKDNGDYLKTLEQSLKDSNKGNKSKTSEFGKSSSSEVNRRDRILWIDDSHYLRIVRNPENVEQSEQASVVKKDMKRNRLLQ